MTLTHEERAVTLAWCSFCNKPDSQVRKLVAGAGVHICDECVALAASIIDGLPAAPPNPADRSGSR